MPKTKGQKVAILASLKEKISASKSIVFAGFNALGAKEGEELRRELKKENSEYCVAKKTLLDLAFKENKILGIDAKSFGGKIAVIFGYQDEVAPAKIMDKFMKGKEGKIEFMGGILENKQLSKTEIIQLAKLPSKLELYGKLVGTLNAPISGFVNVLAGNIRALVNVLKAIEEKKA
jgi:large subunit ribosomal protein L10